MAGGELHGLQEGHLPRRVPAPPSDILLNLKRNLPPLATPA